jgi:hypothetical protein
MDRYDILEAMSGIRDEYIEEAASVQDHAFLSESEEHEEAAGQKEHSTPSVQTPHESGDTARETAPLRKKKKKSGRFLLSAKRSMLSWKNENVIIII